MNIAMKNKVMAGEAIDLSNNPKEGNFYVLDHVPEDIDLCVLKSSEWIWSVGKRKSDGKILASTSTNFYKDSKYDCVWLR